MADLKWLMPMGAWVPWASQAGAPISSVIAEPMSPTRAWKASTMRFSRASRSSREALRQVLKAVLAAATARSTSAAEPALTRPHTSSVAGLTTSMVRGWAGSTHSPPM